MSTCLTTRPLYGTVTTDEPGWTGGARSNAEFSGNHYFAFAIPHATVGAVAGLNDEDLDTHYGSFTHAVMGQRGYATIIEQGAAILGPFSYDQDDRFFLIRRGTDVIYTIRPVGTDDDAYWLDVRYPGLQLPGPILMVSTLPSTGTVFLDSSLYTTADRINLESCGYVWYPGPTEPNFQENPYASTAAVVLPFEVASAGSVDGDGIGGVNSGFGGVEFTFEILARSVTEEGARLEVPFEVLGSDIELDTIAQLELPLEIVADGSGEAFFPTLAGATVALPFDISGQSTPNITGAFIELLFDYDAIASNRGTVLRAGAILELPFTLAGTSSSSFETPMTAGSFLGLPFSVFGTGTDNVETPATAGSAVSLPFELFATGSIETSVAPQAFGFIEVPFDVLGISNARTDNAFRITLSFNAAADTDPVDPPVTEEYDVLETIFATSPELQAYYALPIRERVQLATPVRTFINYTSELADAVQFVTEDRTTFVLQLAEQLNAVDNLSITQVMRVAERLVATGAVDSFYTGMVTVQSAINLSTATIAAFSQTVSDTFAVSEAVADVMYLLSQITDSIGVADSLENVLTITVLETAELQIDDSLELTAQYFNSLLERLEVIALIKTPAELAQGWVVNTEGNMPISEYDNYVFNSMAYSPEQTLGCTDQGLYILDGDDDAGADINAEITSLMLDFDTTKLKRMSTAYVGYTSDGQLLLKVRSVDQGQHIEHWYEGRNPSEQVTPGQNRMKIGKGLRSRYWVFELVNIDGSDFELDKVELYPIVLQRRI